MTLDLLDWRRRVAAIYAEVRAGARSDPEGTLERFRAARDALFATHSQSPLPVEARDDFKGLFYAPYDGDLRFDVDVDTSAEPVAFGITSSAEEAMRLTRFGRVELPIGSLDVYWIDVYGGGVFVPFRDTTAGDISYGGGRYLLDTVKGADLGGEDGRLVLDFNYAYHPSCFYDPRWSCPLAPPGSRLDCRVAAGELSRPL